MAGMAGDEGRGLWPRGARQLGLVTAAFALQWAWQTCSLYLPALASSAASAPWYLNNVMGCAAYAALSALAPQAQQALRSPAMRAAAAALLVGAVAVQEAWAGEAWTAALACAMAAGGGSLFTIMRFDLLVGLGGPSRRAVALLGGTAAQLLLSLVVQTLPAALAAAALLCMPLLLALAVRAAYAEESASERGRAGRPQAAMAQASRADDRPQPGSVPGAVSASVPAQAARPQMAPAPVSAEPGPGEPGAAAAEARPPLPAIPMLALFLLAVGLNFIRSAVDGAAGASGVPLSDGASTLGLVFLVTSAAMAVQLALGRRGADRAAPFCTVLLMMLAAMCVLSDGPAQALASVLSSSGFYVFVVLFWQTTAGFVPEGGQGRATVWVGSATHAVYTLGLALGALAFRAAAPAWAGTPAGPALAVAVASVAASFLLYMRAGQAEEAVKEREALSFPPSLEGAIDADCMILAREAGLTAREEEVVACMARGMGVRATAAARGVGESTVKTHANHAYRKLGVHSREELMALVCETDRRRVGTREQE